MNMNIIKIYIYNSRYDFKEKYDDMDVVLRFLQQLYVTYFNENGISSVAKCKKEILDFVNTRSDRQLYFVCCDIQDAFGSIIQRIIYCSHLTCKYLSISVLFAVFYLYLFVYSVLEKLYDMIITCCEKLGTYLSVRTFILMKTKRSKRKILNTVQILSSNLKKQIPKNAIPSREKPKLVQTQKLINKIYKLIFQQKVKQIYIKLNLQLILNNIFITG